MSQDHLDLLKITILDDASFVRAIFTGTQHGQQHAWKRLEIRPVMLKNRRHLQFSWFDQKQNFVKNYAGDELKSALDEALALPFANITAQTTQGDVQIQFTKKGKALVHHHAPTHTAAPELTHDREKQTVLSTAQPEPFLQAVGIQTEDGRIRANMQHKFTQINEFLRLLEETGEFQGQTSEKPLHVVDCGCGNAYLTFALYHYLTALKGIDCRLTGIDTNRKLLDNHLSKVPTLGWQHLTFEPMRIDQYVPTTQPDMVIALHACDTATDDALALGIRSQSRMIVAVPCCHHNLQAQLSKRNAPPPFTELMKYGLLHQRMGDWLTDAFRALILRMNGYTVDVIEFVGSEHTPKNLMLRAIKTSTPPDTRLHDEYHALKTMWGVSPYLEQILSPNQFSA